MVVTFFQVVHTQCKHEKSLQRSMQIILLKHEGYSLFYRKIFVLCSKEHKILDICPSCKTDELLDRARLTAFRATPERVSWVPLREEVFI